ncbi:spermidine/putrescine ABC transporter ATP-binding protein [Pandoraea terrae]|uniref:Spermidine/putrescine import ATP-binding protein PotA n=1 Tax=Pandoraea terrae TaxID=1537710 RepID=A0A5E4TVA2_9BURK|nr:ABC transporter ATP-binding protein [Pandoraea terrae]VVD91162.1 spermidine/putrescine ABC transporter ATP-binding protein [Pandoraea terrae]
MSVANPKLQTMQLSKRYGDFVALAPTDLVVPEGEFLTLLGPSGSGKTTLLSLIAGLSHPDAGSIHINGIDVTRGQPYERDIGMVFQNYALFPHMTIAENIAFPLRMRKLRARDAAREVERVLEMVRLPHVAQRLPKELSGGQQQRIALARCMVYRPSIILMDEPLGALDKKLRDQMQLEIKRIHRELGTTIVYVTHDQEEAMTMSDRICLMNGGKIEQLGTPQDLYFRPRTPFVADFLGESNLLAATVASVDGDRIGVTLEGLSGHGGVMSNGERFSVGQRIKVMIRPQNMHLVQGAAGAANTLQGSLTDWIVTGGVSKFYMTLANAQPLVVAELTRGVAARHLPGETLTVTWQDGEAVAIPE